MSGLEERIINLESVVMHLQRDMERLNDVLLDHAAALQSLRTRIETFDHRLETLHGDQEIRDPAEERPPHY